MRLLFHSADDMKLEIDALLQDFPAFVYYKLDSIAPFYDVQSHDGIEVYYIWEGTGNYLVGNEVYPLRPGSIVLIRPYTLHKVLLSDSQVSLGRHVLLCKADFAHLPWKEEAGFILDFVAENGLHVQAEGHQQNQVEEMFFRISEELNSKPDGFPSMVRVLIFELLLTVQRLKTSAGSPLPPLQQGEGLPSGIVYLLQYIGSVFLEPVSLEDIADHVHLNKAYLTTLFKKYTGYTIGEYITLQRIHYAKKLLRESSLSVSEVCYRSGYNDPSHFCRTFKHLEHVTPLAYRRHMLKK